MSEGRNDYQSLYNDKPYAVVSEDKEIAFQVCPRCGGESDGTTPACDECEGSGTIAAAQPQPAGTEPTCSHPDCHTTSGLTETDLGVLCGPHFQHALDICRGEKRLMNCEAKLAALQQSHDRIANALRDILGCLVLGKAPQRRFYRGIDRIGAIAEGRNALANAEKLRAAK